MTTTGLKSQVLKRAGPAFPWLAILTLGALIWVVPAGAQMQNPSQPDRDPDLTRQQLSAFDQFLDSHPEMAESLRNNPSLVNDAQYVANHPDLQRYLQDHPEVRQDLSQNPNAVLHQEERFDRREDLDRDGDRDRDRDQDRDRITRGELASMDRFLDNHPEIAEQLRKDPAIVDNKGFVQNHPTLQQYLADHPGVREEIRNNPNAFMHREDRFDQREDQDRDRITRGELASMDRFMDAHAEIAEQLRKDPSLVDKKEFVQNHPALQEFLANHPELREQFRNNPNAFMHQEDRFDQRQDQDRDRINRGELANMDRFMDAHPEIAEQLRKDPSLVDNKEFVRSHPALQDFLANHPQLREAYRNNPNAFMRQEDRFDRREDSGMRGDRDVTRGEISSFHEFLSSHDRVADELSKNPSLANNHEYLENHPALGNYLKAHPQVHEELSENPQSFMKSAQQFGTTAPKMSTAEPKMK